MTFNQLKSCGLSRQKVLGIKSLAKKILDKSFNPKLISKMSDEEAITYLSSLRQIGRWSAEMILLFTYNRSNIWPVQDIGLLRAISKNYNKKYLPPINLLTYLKKGFHRIVQLQHGICGEVLIQNLFSIKSLYYLHVSYCCVFGNVPTILIFRRFMTLNCFFITWELPNDCSHKIITI